MTELAYGIKGTDLFKKTVEVDMDAGPTGSVKQNILTMAITKT